MNASILERKSNSVIIKVEIPIAGPMLDCEIAIQKAVNEVGSLATQEALHQFDADGSPITIGSIKFTTKGKHRERYETPYGKVHVEREVYQSSAGGKTYVPMEQSARTVLNSTPRFAKIISSKYTNFGAEALKRDLLEAHERSISRGYVKDLVDMVGAIAQEKESSWEYALPEFSDDVAAVSIGLDGTCMLMRDDGWREAMAGTISFYNHDGDRMHTIYSGASPEYGKERFKTKFTKEIERVKELFPDIIYLGLADGAKDNWTFLRPHVDLEIIDFFHVSEYLGSLSRIIFKKNIIEGESWLKERLHKLKHSQGAANRILNELEEYKEKIKNKTDLGVFTKTITYFKNHKHRMKYSKNTKENLPIGSGVTEAACKTLIKARMCYSGMRWKDKGAHVVITLRALVLTKNRWASFWEKYSQFGY
jgi:hypothetical protein